MAQQPATSPQVEKTGLSVLLVDDDVELCELMEEFFARNQIRLESVLDSRRGLTRALSGDHELLLLDVMMPGIDGFELLRQLRMAAVWAGSCQLDSYLAGDGTISSTARLTGESGRVDLALEVDGAGQLVRCAIALGG